MKHTSGKLVIFFTSLLIANSVHSIIIYDTFGPNDGYNPNTSLAIGSPTTDPRFPPIEQGIGFTANGSGYLSELTIPLFLFGGTNEINISLMNDQNGLPGGVLESFNILDMLGDFGAPPIMLRSINSTYLSGGSKYWVIGSAPKSDTFAGWGFKYGSISSNNADSASRVVGDTGWSVLSNGGNGALRVTAVSEPTTLALLSFSIVILLLINLISKASPHNFLTNHST